jgi:hypothetical protein
VTGHFSIQRTWRRATTKTSPHPPSYNFYYSKLLCHSSHFSIHILSLYLLSRWLQVSLLLVVDVSSFPAFPRLSCLNCTDIHEVSGLSAAHTIYLAGGNVVVLDKQGFFGGNSTKATSGINGALTRTQVEAGIPDSVTKFYNDTLKSARDKARPDLIKVLTYKSAAAVEWLQDQFNLDLTLVSRLG